MLARFIRLALLLELLAYLGIGAWLHASFGWSSWGLAGLAVIVALASRFAFVAVSTLLSWLTAPRRAPAEQIGAAAMIRCMLAEYRAVLADNFVYLPFESLVTPPEPAAEPTDRIPVVLVHGYFSNRGYFRYLLRWLRSQGVSPVFAPNFSGTFSTIERFADELEAQVERIVAATGQPKVVLVCHSMGGLAARHYLARKAAARVAKLITIASPHAGTALAPLGLGANARQMRRESLFFRELLRCEGGQSACAATSIYTPHDNLVSPQDTSRLPWARNIALPGHGHVSILMSPRMCEVLLGELREAGVKAA